VSARGQEPDHKAPVDSRARIRRNLVYLRAARDRGAIGVAKLAFSIDREGDMISTTIVGSSGYLELDQARIATVRRAQPFRAPAGVDGAKFDFTIPVSSTSGN
jgi:periplasmic protein TonB